LVSSFRSRRNWTIALCAALGLIGASRSPLVFTSVSGDPVELALDDGERALVVHFWATWCPTCVEELGVLDSVAQSCQHGVVRVVTVNVGEEAAQVKAFTRELGLRLPVLRDPRGEMWRELSGVGLPINLIWTHDERRIDIGPHDASAWAETLRSLGCEREP